MLLSLLKSKIHRASITEVDLNYEGSLTIDRLLMERAFLNQYEKVQVVNINNGCRFETYIIEGEYNSGIICLNGAAARLGLKNDLIIIMSFLYLGQKDATTHKPTILHLDEHNHLID